jgi:hypothetical protein
LCVIEQTQYGNLVPGQEESSANAEAKLIEPQFPGLE